MVGGDNNLFVRKGGASQKKIGKHCIRFIYLFFLLSMQRLRVAYNFGCRALYNLPWRASVSRHQVQCNIPTFEALLRKTCSLPVSRKMQKVEQRMGCVLWCRQIVCIRPYSLNTTTAFYFVTECPYIAVFVWWMACHATTHSYFTWARPVRELTSCSAVVLHQCHWLATNSVRYVSLILWLCLQRRCKTFCWESDCNPAIQPAQMPLYKVVFTPFLSIWVV